MTLFAHICLASCAQIIAPGLHTTMGDPDPLRFVIRDPDAGNRHNDDDRNLREEAVCQYIFEKLLTLPNTKF